MASPVVESAVVGSQANCSTFILCKPTGTVAGDLLIAFIGNDNGIGIAIQTPNTKTGSFGNFRTYAAGVGDITVLVRVAGCCEPGTYTFSTCTGATDWIGVLDRVSGAARDFDESVSEYPMFACRDSVACCDCCFTCNPYNHLQVCATSTGDYLAYVAASGGGGTLCNIITVTNCCCYTTNIANICVTIDWWMYRGHKQLTGVCFENAGCFTRTHGPVGGGKFVPLSLLVREICCSICNNTSVACVPVIETFTNQGDPNLIQTCMVFTKPACVAVGDMLLAIIGRRNCAGSINIGCGCGCCGFVVSDSHDGGLLFFDIDLVFKIADGTEACSITFNGTNARNWFGHMLRISGTRGTAPGLNAVDQTTFLPNPPLTTIGLTEPNLVIAGTFISGQAPISLRGTSTPLGFSKVTSGGNGQADSLKVIGIIACKGYNSTISDPPPWTICNTVNTVPYVIGIAPDITVAPVVLTELCVFQYRGIQGVASAQDLCFILCVLEWRERIETGAVVIGVGLYENIAFPLNFAKINIRLTAILPPNHGEHPLTVDACCNAIAHLPDFVDIEEAAIAFNQIGIAKDKVSISLPLPAGIRTYEGVIESVALITPPGTVFRQLILNFQVAWNPSFPKLRVWNDE